MITNSMRAASGWSERYSCHLLWLSGVVMLAASGGTRTAVDVLEIMGQPILQPVQVGFTAAWLKRLVS